MRHRVGSMSVSQRVAALLRFRPAAAAEVLLNWDVRARIPSTLEALRIVGRAPFAGQIAVCLAGNPATHATTSPLARDYISGVRPRDFQDTLTEALRVAGQEDREARVLIGICCCQADRFDLAGQCLDGADRGRSDLHRSFLETLATDDHPMSQWLGQLVDHHVLTPQTIAEAAGPPFYSHQATFSNALNAASNALTAAMLSLGREDFDRALLGVLEERAQHGRAMTPFMLQAQAQLKARQGARAIAVAEGPFLAPP